MHLCCVVCPKCKPQERNPCAPKFEQDIPGYLATRKMRPQKHGTWRKKSTSSKNKDLATFCFPTEAWVMLAPSSKEARGARIRGRFRSITAHADQKKDLRLSLWGSANT